MNDAALQRLADRAEISDFLLAFGRALDTTRSGDGRELGEDGVREFVDVTSVALHAAPAPAPVALAEEAVE